MKSLTSSSVFFFFSAALQYNDPDPYIWMPIYMYGLCFAGWHSSKFYPKSISSWYYHLFIYAIGLFLERRCVGLDKQARTEDIAATISRKTMDRRNKEFFELIILIVVLAINYFYAKKELTGLLITQKFNL
jgi:hypothetical protein